MAKIPIWPGSSSFASHANPTAFGFYDSDLDFRKDADNVATWCVQRLGYPLVDVELQDINLFSAFEEAVSEYGHQVYTFQIINNLGRIKGTSTGSALNQILIDVDYGNNLGTGGTSGQSGLSYNLTDQRLFSASLDVKKGKQKYNLLSSSPGYASTSITFNSTSSVSSSITLTDTPGASVEFVSHASSSTYVVSGSQFETGSTNIETALNFQQVVASSSLLINATVSQSVVSLTQRIEGPDGNSAVTFGGPTFEVSSSNFSGGATGLNFEQSGSAIQAGLKQIKIKKIYHYSPAAINRYFDPYAGTGTGIQSLMQTFGFGNYSPGVNFMLMPLYFDTLKLQAIELNDQIRKSAYHFELNAGRYLKLFPIPTNDYKLWFDYTIADSSISAATEETDPDVEKPTNTITDISNAPYEKPTYAFINEPGRQWTRKYTLALAKEMLGGIRGKYQSLPIPGAETTLDYSRLLSEAANEKEALIAQLREDLDATTTLRQAERSTAESEQTQTLLGLDNPYQIYIH